MTDLKDETLVIVSPDIGAVETATSSTPSILGRPLGMLYKERDYSRVAQSAEHGNITDMRLLGSVAGKTVLMCDDMLGTGGTLIKAMRVLKEHGCGADHRGREPALFTARAVDSFDAAYREGLFHRIIGTNAVFHGDEVLRPGMVPERGRVRTCSRGSSGDCTTTGAWDRCSTTAA